VEQPGETAVQMEKIEPMPIVEANITTAPNETVTTVVAPVVLEDNTTAMSANPAAQTRAEVKLQSIYFGVNSFLLSDAAKAMVLENVKQVKDNNVVRLEGNCDERGSDEYNVALGLKRTNAVKEFLQANGLKIKTIESVSLGESQPVCTQANEACWAQNRRVDFKLPR
jgi:peptidoglycan-associated lipoprotein